MNTSPFHFVFFPSRFLSLSALPLIAFIVVVSISLIWWCRCSHFEKIKKLFVFIFFFLLPLFATFISNDVFFMPKGERYGIEWLHKSNEFIAFGITIFEIRWVNIQTWIFFFLVNLNFNADLDLVPSNVNCLKFHFAQWC